MDCMQTVSTIFEPTMMLRSLEHLVQPSDMKDTEKCFSPSISADKRTRMATISPVHENSLVEIHSTHLKKKAQTNRRGKKSKAVSMTTRSAYRTRSKVMSRSSTVAYSHKGKKGKWNSTTKKRRMTSSRKIGRKLEALRRRTLKEPSIVENLAGASERDSTKTTKKAATKPADTTRIMGTLTTAINSKQRQQNMDTAKILLSLDTTKNPKGMEGHSDEASGETGVRNARTRVLIEHALKINTNAAGGSAKFKDCMKKLRKNGEPVLAAKALQNFKGNSSKKNKMVLRDFLYSPAFMSETENFLSRSKDPKARKKQSDTSTNAAPLKDEQRSDNLGISYNFENDAQVRSILRSRKKKEKSKQMETGECWTLQEEASRIKSWKITEEAWDRLVQSGNLPYGRNKVMLTCKGSEYFGSIRRDGKIGWNRCAYANPNFFVIGVAQSVDPDFTNCATLNTLRYKFKGEWISLQNFEAKMKEEGEAESESEDESESESEIKIKSGSESEGESERESENKGERILEYANSEKNIVENRAKKQKADTVNAPFSHATTIKGITKSSSQMPKLRTKRQAKSKLYATRLRP